VKKATLLIAAGEENRLGSAERRIIIEAYSYLYSQRFGTLFDNCHNALWKLTVAESKKGFLLRLFRFSSFLWRIFGRHQKEKEYLTQLRALIPALPSQAKDLSEEKNSFACYTSRLKALGDFTSDNT
jgi:hypothetical protein